MEGSKYAYLKSAEVGDIVEFGNYNGFTTWRVLDKSDNNLLIITENVVDRKPFDEKNVKCDWSSCTLRTWLNNDYYNNVFSDEEKGIITEVNVDGVKDRIYLLSFDEAQKYFSSDDDRIARNSSRNAEWWLRSPVYFGGSTYFGSYVLSNGRVLDYDEGVYHYYGVRPALNIDLTKFSSNYIEEQETIVSKIESDKTIGGPNNDKDVKDGKYASLKSAEVGDIVEFGNYIGYTTWRVLDKSDNNLLIITENVVDINMQFNQFNVKCDWSSCTLRTWLNINYYNGAFTDEEKELITETDVDGVKDKIYLLSSNEAKKYFSSNDDRIPRNSSVGTFWWLRSPVYYSYGDSYGSGVNFDGSVYEGSYIVSAIIGVRPVLNIDLSNL